MIGTLYVNYLRKLVTKARVQKKLDSSTFSLKLIQPQKWLKIKIHGVQIKILANLLPFQKFSSNLEGEQASTTHRASKMPIDTLP